MQSSNRLPLSLAAVFLLAACGDEPTAPNEGIPLFGEVRGNRLKDEVTNVKVSICHKWDNKGWKTLFINGDDLQDHIDHGDGVPNGDVPGMDGYVFDESCVPVAAGPKVFAIAYTDVDPNDGQGFKRGTDVLIAKVVDSNLDGVLSVGDDLITGSYPRDFAASDYGFFAVTMHEIEVVGTAVAGEVYVFQLSGPGYRFKVDEYGESYGEADFAYPHITAFYDHYSSTSPGDDQIHLSPGSPSQPQDDVPPIYHRDVTDNAFIDVEINLGGL